MLTQRHTLRALAVGLGALLWVGIPGPVSASPANCHTDQTTGDQVCDVVANPPGGPGGGGSAPGHPGSGTKVTCTFQGEEIDCSNADGAWNAARQCWVHLASPQPGPDEPAWQGHTDGALYWCVPPSGVGGSNSHAWGTPTLYWAAAPPPRVNPEVLARQAVASMHLVAPTVGATPRPSREAVSLIGLPTWLWIEGADPHSWGPITRTASAGGVTVTATAKVDRVVWDMGNGKKVVCRNKGTEWTRARGVGDSPTCGYRYTRRGPHTITATTYWNVDWSGAGQAGTITFDMSGTRDIEVVELRAVITS